MLHECKHHESNRKATGEFQLTNHDDFLCSADFATVLQKNGVDATKVQEAFKDINSKQSQGRHDYLSSTELSYVIFLHQTPKWYIKKPFPPTSPPSPPAASSATSPPSPPPASSATSPPAPSPTSPDVFQAVVINNIPADLFAGSLLNSHDVAMKKIFKELVEGKGIFPPQPSKGVDDSEWFQDIIPYAVIIL